MIRKLLASVSLALAAAHSVAQAASPTPSTLSSYLGSVPWTNGRGLVTGQTIYNAHTIEQQILSGMGTWDSNGNYSIAHAALPALLSTDITTALTFTPANKAGDTFLGNTLFAGPSQSINQAYAAARPFNASGVSSQSDAISYCALNGCVYLDAPGVSGTPAGLDHQRANTLLSSITADDGHSFENTLGVETTIATGYTTTWAASTPYAANANVIPPGTVNVYRAAAACTSGSTAPTGYSSGIADGSCSWTWINNANNDAKAGIYNDVSAVAGGGASWGAIDNLTLRNGFIPRFVATHELDLTNQAQSCTLGSVTCQALYIGVAGYKNSYGIGLSSSNTASSPGADHYASYYGMLIGGQYLDSDADIMDQASGATGLQFANGSHSSATILDFSSSQNGISLLGTYSSNQILGNFFSIDKNGALSLSNTSLSAPPILISGAGQVNATPGVVNKVAVFGTSYGLGISAGSMEHDVPASAQNDFYAGGVKTGTVGPGGKPGVRVPPVTVANLPACSASLEGTWAAVTDANSSTYNATAAGGGTNHMPVYCNGTSWTLH